MSEFDREELRDVLISVLNSPIPQSPAVGSIYDVLQSLDRVLPHGGKLVITKEKGTYAITLEPR